MSDSPQPRRWAEARADVRPWKVPLVAVEWGSGWLINRLDRLAVTNLLGMLGRFSIIIGIISYVAGAPARRRSAEDARKAKHYQAWEVINGAAGHGGNGGRIDALQDLNADGIRLTGVDLARSILTGVCLPLADLQLSRLDSADLSGADLRGADLRGAALRGTILRDADLRGARLLKANLTLADLRGADLRGVDLAAARADSAFLQHASLDFADLEGASLSGTRLESASLANAVLVRADLRGAEGRRANWDSTDLALADLRGAKLGQPPELALAMVRNANVVGLRFRQTLPPEPPIDPAAAAGQLHARGAVSIPDENQWRAFAGHTPHERRGSAGFLHVWNLRREQEVEVNAVFGAARALVQCPEHAVVHLPLVRD